MHDPGAETPTPEETHVGGDPVSDPEGEAETPPEVPDESDSEA